MTYTLNLSILANGKTANLSLKATSQADRTQVLDLLAGLFKVEPEKVNSTVLKLDKINFTPPTPKQKEQPEDVKKQVSRKLPIVDSNRTEMVSLGEKLQEALLDKEPEYYKTGIKIDEDGTKRYKCRYVCSCGKRGNHYIPLKTEEVPCFECGQPLYVSLAAGEVNAQGIPARDAFGNYYVAGV